MFNINKITLSPIKTSSFLLLSCISSFANAAESHGLLLNSKVTIAQDDNILKNSNEIEDQYISLQPVASFNSFIGKHDVSVNYEGKLNAYKDNTKFNYFNHSLSTGLKLNHNYRTTTLFSLTYQDSIEEPNTTISPNINLDEFNKFDQLGFDVGFIYGSEDSKGQIRLGYKLADKHFNNNQQEFRNVFENALSAAFYYRLSIDTRIVFLGRVTDFDYKNTSISDQSSTDYALLTGLSWKSSTTTTGEFRIGYQSKHFESDIYQDVDGLTYELDLTWMPQTYTTINLGSARRTTESSIIDSNAYKTTSYYVNISHNIYRRTNILVGFEQNKSDLQGNNVDQTFQSSTDKLSTTEIGITHNLRTWLDVNLSYKYEEKNSINTVFDYKANIIQLSFETIFE